jgi:hypothetical protein
MMHIVKQEQEEWQKPLTTGEFTASRIDVEKKS